MSNIPHFSPLNHGWGNDGAYSEPWDAKQALTLRENVTVEHRAMLHRVLVMGDTLEEVAKDHNLTVSEVYSALARMKYRHIYKPDAETVSAILKHFDEGIALHAIPGYAHTSLSVVTHTLLRNGKVFQVEGVELSVKDGVITRNIIKDSAREQRDEQVRARKALVDKVVLAFPTALNFSTLGKDLGLTHFDLKSILREQGLYLGADVTPLHEKRILDLAPNSNTATHLATQVGTVSVRTVKLVLLNNGITLKEAVVQTRKKKQALQAERRQALLLDMTPQKEQSYGNLSRKQVEALSLFYRGTPVEDISLKLKWTLRTVSNLVEKFSYEGYQEFESRKKKSQEAEKRKRPRKVTKFESHAADLFKSGMDHEDVATAMNTTLDRLNSTLCKFNLPTQNGGHWFPYDMSEGEKWAFSMYKSGESVKAIIGKVGYTHAMITGIADRMNYFYQTKEYFVNLCHTIRALKEEEPEAAISYFIENSGAPFLDVQRVLHILDLEEDEDEDFWVPSVN